jgi:manganese/zinc/iron transport system substrate-binding protein
MLVARRTIASAAFGLALALGLVPGLWAPLAAEPLRIVTTTSQLADLARNVAGDRAEVTALMARASTRISTARRGRHSR